MIAQIYVYISSYGGLKFEAYLNPSVLEDNVILNFTYFFYQHSNGAASSGGAVCSRFSNSAFLMCGG
ncbi:hypothetical protein VNO77_01310 [Canavalia gladiata]|uniref:Uncharacterized protein n=1 Tax=Canavalia gladiata TaxID=3824 RepID=A0AAN9MQZ5_CANGL